MSASSKIAVNRITVPDFVTRPLDKVSDYRDQESIRKMGVQQAVVCVVDEEGRILLVKGLRRLRISKALGLPKIPYIIAPVPKGKRVLDYVRELRLALDMHRQDLLPSQKCAFVLELKARFGMKNKEIAAYIGIDADSVTNWLAVRRYIPEVAALLDREILSFRVSRAFDGLSEDGQRHVLKKHMDILTGEGKTEAHKAIRALYPPDKHPDMYRNAKVTAERLARKKAKRGTPRHSVTHDEKRRLASSVEMKEIELREGNEDLRRYLRENQAAAVPINAIMRSEKLRGMLGEEVAEEFERFTEVY